MKHTKQTNQKKTTGETTYQCSERIYRMLCVSCIEVTIIIAEQEALALLNFEYLARYVRTIWNAINPCPRPLRIPCNNMA